MINDKKIKRTPQHPHPVAFSHPQPHLQHNGAPANFYYNNLPPALVNSSYQRQFMLNNGAIVNQVLNGGLPGHYDANLFYQATPASPAPSSTHRNNNNNNGALNSLTSNVNNLNNNINFQLNTGAFRLAGPHHQAAFFPASPLIGNSPYVVACSLPSYLAPPSQHHMPLAPQSQQQILWASPLPATTHHQGFTMVPIKSSYSNLIGQPQLQPEILSSISNNNPMPSSPSSSNNRESQHIAITNTIEPNATINDSNTMASTLSSNIIDITQLNQNLIRTSSNPNASIEPNIARNFYNPPINNMPPQAAIMTSNITAIGYSPQNYSSDMVSFYFTPSMGAFNESNIMSSITPNQMINPLPNSPAEPHMPLDGSKNMQLKMGLTLQNSINQSVPYSNQQSSVKKYSNTSDISNSTNRLPTSLIIPHNTSITNSPLFTPLAYNKISNIVNTVKKSTQILIVNPDTGDSYTPQELAKDYSDRSSVNEFRNKITSKAFAPEDEENEFDSSEAIEPHDAKQNDSDNVGDFVMDTINNVELNMEEKPSNNNKNDLENNEIQNNEILLSPAKDAPVHMDNTKFIPNSIEIEDQMDIDVSNNVSSNIELNEDNNIDKEGIIIIPEPNVSLDNSLSQYMQPKILKYSIPELINIGQSLDPVYCPAILKSYPLIFVHNQAMPNINKKIPVHDYRYQYNQNIPTRNTNIMYKKPPNISSSSENAWKSLEQRKHKMDTEMFITEELIGKVKAILNKMAPNNFNILLEDFKELNKLITTDERVEGVVGVIFNKALLEPVYADAYANFLKILANLCNVTTCKPMSVLLNMSQKEFYTDGELKSIKDKEWNKKIEEATNETERRFLEEDYHEYLLKTQDRYLGNIKFLSELYKHALISDKIFSDCVNTLFKTKTDLAYEGLCNLLRFAGKVYIDRNKVQKDHLIDDLILSFSDLVQENLLPPRIRFMIIDIIELKNNDWVPRRDEEVPKTFEQIDKEIALENEEGNKIAAAATAKKHYIKNNKMYSKPRSISPLTAATNLPEETKSLACRPSSIVPRQTNPPIEQMKLAPKKWKLAKSMPNTLLSAAPIPLLSLSTDKPLASPPTPSIVPSDVTFNDILTEYFSNDQNIELVQACLAFNLSTVLAIPSVFNHVFDQPLTKRHKYGAALSALLNANCIVLKDVIQAMASYLTAVEDHLEDYPMLFEYLADVLKPLIIPGDSNMSEYYDILLTSLPNESHRSALTIALNKNDISFSS